MKRIFAIVGPTGCGKTGLALAITKYIPIEVISLDSRQIYKMLDIGTAKPTLDEQQQLKHHLIDLLNPTERLDVVYYTVLVKQSYNQILQLNKYPVLVGGTGFYLEVMENGICNGLEQYEDIHTDLLEKYNSNGIEKLHEELAVVDPEAAQRLPNTDKQRIIRALEVFYGSGKTLTWWQQNNTPVAGDWQVEKQILDLERNQLYKQIDIRTDNMIKLGLIDEVKNLLALGIDEKYNSMRTIGYSEIIKYLKNELSYEETIELIKRNTRRYAKRQLTWFRRYERQSWLQYDPDMIDAIAKMIAQQIEEFYAAN
jgi:tRNA dimethylallyltransferase